MLFQQSLSHKYFQVGSSFTSPSLLKNRLQSHAHSTHPLPQNSYSSHVPAKASLNKQKIAPLLGNTAETTSTVGTLEQAKWLKDQQSLYNAGRINHRSQFNPVLQAKHGRETRIEVESEEKRQKSGRDMEWTKVDAAKYV